MCDGNFDAQPLRVYHDRYQRTPVGWTSTERVCEVRYLDTTALAGPAPSRHAQVHARIVARPELNDWLLFPSRSDQP